jgi:hypothetical protein
MVNPLTTLNLLQLHGLSSFAFFAIKYANGTSIAPKGTMQRHGTQVVPMLVFGVSERSICHRHICGQDTCLLIQGLCPTKTHSVQYAFFHVHFELIVIIDFHERQVYPACASAGQGKLSFLVKSN